MSEESNNYFVKLYRGEVPLVITYWVFYFIIGSIVYLMLPLLGIIVNIFFMIAVWNSAGHYQGSSIWKTLARLMVILGVIAMVLAMVGVSPPPV